MGSERTLLCLALHDEPTLKAALTVEPDRAGVPPLDPRTQALVRLGVCIALEAAPVTYAWGVDAALAAGATVEEIVGTLLAVAPVVGIARVVAAAPALAGAIGYDVDSALERR